MTAVKSEIFFESNNWWQISEWIETKINRRLYLKCFINYLRMSTL